MDAYSTLIGRYICIDCRWYFKRPTPFQCMERDGVIGQYNRLDLKQKGMIVEDDTPVTMTEEDQAAWVAIQQKYFQPVVCPRCAKPVQSVGPSFKAPKKEDVKGWARLK